jgi:predicted nucleic acid-binding protein
VKSVLVDTSALVAALDRRSEAHEATRIAFEAFGRRPLITCQAVVTEACFLFQSRKLHGARKDLLANVVAERLTLGNAAVEVVNGLMDRYARVPMQYADGCLVDLADQLETDDILTLDSDFRVYRWRRTRHFQMWPES